MKMGPKNYTIMQTIPMVARLVQGACGAVYEASLLQINTWRYSLLSALSLAADDLGGASRDRWFGDGSSSGWRCEEVA